jgi:uncharacterized protein YllA (UPF0747 family)
MNCTVSLLTYRQTESYSRIVLDYINQQESLKDFYRHPPSIDGIKAAIKERKSYNTDRTLLTDVLSNQYLNVETTSLVKDNINSLSNTDTFAICTAHQPNIFTGHLYFIYKILHTIKMATWLSVQIPDCHFVPVYYMGSEDADLEELGHIYINGEKHEWKTSQNGAVGRMKIDKGLIELLDHLNGQLSVYPYGNEILSLMKQFYTWGKSIEEATFKIVNSLFAEYGLVVLLPDNSDLKRSFLPIIEQELFEAFSHNAVEETVSKFPPAYKAQASGREMNMFYLMENKRERIEQVGDEWQVLNSELKFSRTRINSRVASAS